MIRHGSKVADTNVIKLSSARRMSIWDQLHNAPEAEARVLARELPLKEQLRASVARKEKAMTEAEAVQDYKIQVVRERAELAPVVPEDKMQILGDVIAPGLTPTQLEVFALACNRTRLDPFAKQICAVIRWDSELQRNKMTVQTTIDGFRVIAERTGKYAGRKPFEWCGPDGVWVEVWLKKEPPAAARARVLRRDFPEPLTAIARYKAYVATKQGGAPTYMWQKMDAEQLAKCAEALALRTAFPQELSGLYTEDELEQAGMTDAAVLPETPPNTVPASVTSSVTAPSKSTPPPPPAAKPKSSPGTTPAEPCFSRLFPIKQWARKPMSSADAETLRDYIAWCEGVIADRSRNALHNDARASMKLAEDAYDKLVGREMDKAGAPAREDTTERMTLEERQGAISDAINDSLDDVYARTRGNPNDDFPESWRGR